MIHFSPSIKVWNNFCGWQECITNNIQIVLNFYYYLKLSYIFIDEEKVILIRSLNSRYFHGWMWKGPKSGPRVEMLTHNWDTRIRHEGISTFGFSRYLSAPEKEIPERKREDLRGLIIIFPGAEHLWYTFFSQKKKLLSHFYSDPYKSVCVLLTHRSHMYTQWK